jgi:hypothetical protein
MPGTQRRKRRDIVVIGAALTATLLAADLLFYPDTTEDAFITFRYSEHLAEGFGFGAWNQRGERVEGYTSTLWMLALSAAPASGMRIETLAKALGVASQIGLCWLLLAYPRARRDASSSGDALLGGDADVFAIAALVCGLYLPGIWYATSGMEASAFGLLVALALLIPAMTDAVFVVGLVYAALIAMRPEGALIGAVFIALHGIAARADGRPLRTSASALLGWSAALVGLTGFRLATFGEWVPNTWFAKAAGAGDLHTRLGNAYVVDWANHHTVWVLAFAVAAAAVLRALRQSGARAQLGTAGVLGLAIVFTLYIARVGGDNPSAFPLWRQFLHVLPLFGLIVGLAICAVTQHRGLRFALATACIAVTHYPILDTQPLPRQLAVAAERYPQFSHRPPNPFYVWLARIAGPDAVIASAAAGEMPYLVDAQHVDMLGLNDREIAHQGRFDADGPIDSKSDIDSVMRRRPDLIQSTLHSGRFEEVSPRENRILHRGEMEAALLNHPDFVRDYLYVRNAPYEFRDRALFVRRDFWNAHPDRNLLDTVNVLDTAIYPKRR